MRILTLAILFGMLIVFGACDAIDSVNNSGESGSNSGKEGCYSTSGGLMRIEKVVDSLGNEYQPAFLEKGPSFFDRGCGIHRDAVPFHDSDLTVHGNERGAWWFEVPEGGITDLTTSLTGQQRELPTRLFVGNGYVIHWDDLPMWPLRGLSWGEYE